MNLVRALYSCVCGNFAILLFAGAAVAQADSSAASAGAASAGAASAGAASAGTASAGADSAGTDSAGTDSAATSAIDMRAIDNVDECMVAQICIDRYLWSLYERTPKTDTIKVPEEIKVSVKRKGKTRIITKTITKLVDEDFTWKDPKAAARAGMSPIDYVIGGMDPNFRVTLYHALRALDEAGLAPGITSAFRDDYRQTIAAGQKAGTDRSYHGGSFRGGYGHGLAADIVSVKGETRAERWVSSEQLWKWIDTHEKELGIGRPYRDRDAPHVAPIDGREYAVHRVEPSAQHAEAEAKKHQRVDPSAQHAEAEAKKHQRVALRNDRGLSKHTRAARPSRAQSKQQTRST